MKCLNELKSQNLRRREFHAVLGRVERELHQSSAIDEDLSPKRVYVHGISKMRVEKLEDRVNYAELPVCGNDKRLDHGMSVQEVTDELVVAGIVYCYICFGQLPNDFFE
ncbi:unnamed protein product, partial [Linum tenue]